MLYKCTLLEPDSDRCYVIERDDDGTWKLSEGPWCGTLQEVETLKFEFYRDGGTVIAYTVDGRLIRVPQQTFLMPNHPRPIIGQWETTRAQFQRLEQELPAEWRSSHKRAEQHSDTEPGYCTPTSEVPGSRSLVLIEYQLGAR